MKKKENKTSLYLWGALLGLAVGLTSAYLYGRALEENRGEEDDSARFSSGNMMKLGLLLIGVIRQIAELGASSEKKPAES